MSVGRIIRRKGRAGCDDHLRIGCGTRSGGVGPGAGDRHRDADVGLLDDEIGHAALTINLQPAADAPCALKIKQNPGRAVGRLTTKGDRFIGLGGIVRHGQSNGRDDRTSIAIPIAITVSISSTVAIGWRRNQAKLDAPGPSAHGKQDDPKKPDRDPTRHG